MADGIVWILRTSEPWRDLPERYGNWNSVIVRLTADRHRIRQPAITAAPGVSTD